MNFSNIPIAIRNFFRNLRTLFKYSYEQDCIETIQSLNRRIANLQEDLFFSKREIIELYFDFYKEEAKPYIDELAYLRDSSNLDAFPYPQIKHTAPPISDYDQKQKLPFVMHKNNRLYFPKGWSLESASNAYRNYIERENLLGGGYTEKAPHQYVTESFHVEQNDIVVDAGCAEALFALDSIEKAKHIYLLEADTIWLKPLQATFAPYKNKVTIIPKFLGNENYERAITLNSLFDGFSKESFFIKLDIEGAEESVIQGSKDFLTSQNKIKLACCTYHKAHHPETIPSMLKDMGYNFEFSDGYMLFPWDKNMQPPYFRKGLIRATRESV